MMHSDQPTLDEILEMEQRGLDRWCAGDPSGFLEICAPDVSYFDPFLGQRIDGLDQLIAYYEGLRGRVDAPDHEMLDPRVQDCGPTAVLTYRFVSSDGNGDQQRWNCTEVYRREPPVWRIAHTHWSFTGPS